MFAEHTLGLADYLIRKATNMRVEFLDGKVKCKINKTFLWLCSHSRDDQDKLVKFCIKQARKVIGMHAKLFKMLQKYRINDKNA